MYNAPSLGEMFPDAPASQLVDRFEAFKAALSASHASTRDQDLRFVAGSGAVPGGASDSPTAVLTALESIGKSVSPDTLSALTAHLDGIKGMLPDLSKDWSSGNPLASGLVAFDLEAPAKLLLPRRTPLRNRTPRMNDGVGTTRRFKRITGVTNLGVGGVADQSVFFNSESTTNTFGGVTGLRRPNKITYAADEKAIIFQESGLSDSVTSKAQFQAQGYQDLRQLSHSALLYASLVGEEKALLKGRGTASGFGGALSAPTGVAATAATPGTGQTGNTANIANLFIYVTAKGGFGESVPSTVLNSTALSAVTGKTLSVTWTDVNGALGYNVYAGTTTGIANAFFYGTTQTNSFTMSFTGAGTGGALNAGAQSTGADSSADANGYDGFLAILTDPTQAGYVNRQNANFSTTNPGGEFQTAFSSMFAKNLADPNIVWIYPQGRVALSDLLKTASSANYRLSVQPGEYGAGTFLGSIVTGLLNEVTGTMVDLEVHPYMPPGVALIHSETLPEPDTQITNTVEVHNVVEYMAIDWPQIQLTWDVSTYWFGAPIFYAPAWSGAILGIAN